MKKNEREPANQRRYYVIGETTFPTKVAVEKHLQHILYSYQPGEMLTSEHSRFLLALLHNHPKAEEKFGCGVHTFVVRQNPRFTTKRGFYLIRLDGTEDDFSFKNCLYPSSPLTLFKAACRRLIGRRIFWIKADYFRNHANADGQIQCPITGQWITREQAHVDHSAPATFECIVTDFIREYTIQVDQVPLVEATGQEVGLTFADPLLAQNWIAFHDARASFRIVSAFANLSILKREPL